MAMYKFDYVYLPEGDTDEGSEFLTVAVTLDAVESPSGSKYEMSLATDGPIDAAIIPSMLNSLSGTKLKRMKLKLNEDWDISICMGEDIYNLKLSSDMQSVELIPKK